MWAYLSSNYQEMRRVLLTILLLTIGLLATALAQEYREKLNKLFQQLRYASSNIARVDLMNKIAFAYQHELQLPHHELDSALFYSKQALTLSKKIHYIQGYWVALDRTYDSYCIAGNISKAFEVIENIYDTHVVKMLYSSGVVYKGSIWRKPNKDSALIFYRKALLISEKLKDDYFIFDTKKRIFNLYAKMGDTATVKREMKVFERNNQPLHVAIAWQEIGNGVPEQTDVSFKLSCLQRALDIYRHLGDKVHTGEVLLAIGDVYDGQGNTAIAENYYLEAVALLKQSIYPNTYQAYLCLHDLYYYRGDLDKAVHYSLEAVRSAEKYGIEDIRGFFRYDGSFTTPGHIEKIHQTPFTLLKATVKEMIKEGKVQEALNYALSETNKTPFFGPTQNITNVEVLGYCYASLGRRQEAEQYYLKMLDYTPYLPKQFTALAHFTIGKFYYESGQYAKAAPYLQQYLQYPSQFTAMTGLSEAHLFLYKIDSARQDLHAALQHFRAYKEITDTLFSTAKSRQIEELKIQYDIDKKDQTLQLQLKDIELLTKQKLLQQSLAEQKSKDVLLKQRNIDLLTQEKSFQEMITGRQQQELQQKENALQFQKENISLLQNRDQLQKSQLKQADFIKRMTIAGIVLLLMIMSLLYNQYRIKQRNNRAISEKNERLNNLLEEKDGLLQEKEGLLEEKEGLIEEKEWLIKEVHHRVKNNLQVVLSLPEGRSAGSPARQPASCTSHVSPSPETLPVRQYLHHQHGYLYP
jgi:two-component system, sensor histidine kinase PdtaS